MLQAGKVNFLFSVFQNTSINVCVVHVLCHCFAPPPVASLPDGVCGRSLITDVYVALAQYAGHCGRLQVHLWCCYGSAEL